VLLTGPHRLAAGLVRRRLTRPLFVDLVSTRMPGRPARPVPGALPRPGPCGGRCARPVARAGRPPGGARGPRAVSRPGLVAGAGRGSAGPVVPSVVEPPRPHLPRHPGAAARHRPSGPAAPSEGRSGSGGWACCRGGGRRPTHRGSGAGPLAVALATRSRWLAAAGRVWSVPRQFRQRVQESLVSARGAPGCGHRGLQLARGHRSRARRPVARSSAHAVLTRRRSRPSAASGPCRSRSRCRAGPC
jgi:hypothetical protein